MNRDGYTGHLFEEEVLGTCRVEWHGYMTFHKSMDLVRSHQPCDPTDPSPRQANNFHARVAMAMGLEDWSELKLYSALGTPLDYLHGIDGFFEFKGRVVTFDLTINPNKDEYKADIIITPEMLEKPAELVNRISRQLAGVR
jgi:hypothetical protein